MIARNPRRGERRREDQVRHLLGLVELGEVASTGQQEQLRHRELLVEVAGHTSVQVGVTFAKNYPHRTPERPHLGLGSGPAPNGAQKVVIESEEGWLGAGRGCELLVEERHELFPHLLVADEPLADLPPVHAAKQSEPARDEPSDVPQNGRGEEEDRLGPPRRRRGPVECVQQHERRNAFPVPQSPVDRRRSRGVMSDKNDTIEPQVRYHGAQVASLVVRSVRVTFGLVRPTPTKKVEDYHPPARKMRHKPVVEVHIVREAVHQHDRGFLARILPRVDSVRTPCHRVFPVLHLLLLSSDHRYGSVVFRASRGPLAARETILETSPRRASWRSSPRTSTVSCWACCQRG